jgi:ATP-dependent DNA helicase RecQ
LSPEKLQSEFIQNKIGQLEVNLIAVDEAHCISEWGHDFRPAYLKIPILKNILPDVKMIALTATATPKVMTDIVENLELSDVQIFSKSFYRNNLFYNIIKTENALHKLKQILLKIDEPVIVYAGSRKRSIDISNFLNRNNFKSQYYHGGMDSEEKSKALENWMNEKIPIIVATNAFGMGIDKSNVRAVIHMNIPYSVENYQQEVGRAGRDGFKSYATLIFNDGSIIDFKSYLEKGIVTPKYSQQVYEKINQFYQIGNGELNDRYYHLNLQDFCNTYDLSLLKTYYVLNSFESENIIDIKQNFNKKSAFKIIVKNSFLFEYEKLNPRLYNTLKVILRNYGGAFDQFIKINEGTIAKKLNQKRIEVIKSLKQLENDNIIIYQKSTSDLKLKFLVPRDEKFVMAQISENLKKKNKVKIQKAKSIISYVENNGICRNVQLLNYFGEKNIQECGKCDVCISKKKRETRADYSNIANKITNILKTDVPTSYDELVSQLDSDKKSIIKTLQLMVEKNSIRLTSQNKIIKNK